MPYPIIMNGDHAEFEAEWAASGRPDNERPDWPLPSFDARDWAAAFCKIANGFGFKDVEGKPLDEGWMITWFANALMRGYDHRTAEEPGEIKRLRPIEDAAWAVWAAVEHTNDHTTWFKPLSDLKAALDASVAEENTALPASERGL